MKTNKQQLLEDFGKNSSEWMYDKIMELIHRSCGYTNSRTAFIEWLDKEEGTYF